jgi:tetraacyldisaccharide 4'-kinase
VKNQIKKALAKVDVFEYAVVNKGFRKLNSKETLPVDALKGQKALAFCGIARPDRFSALLKGAGMAIIHFLKFPDHYPYPPSSLKKIARRFSELKPAVAITTEKDALKIAADDKVLKSIPVYYLKIDLDLEEKFYQRISSCLQNLA